MPRRTCVQCGCVPDRLRGNHGTLCPACYAPPAKPCAGCDERVPGKVRVRMGDGLEGLFCRTCAPVAREAAALRERANRVRWGRGIYLGAREAA